MVCELMCLSFSRLRASAPLLSSLNVPAPHRKADRPHRGGGGGGGEADTVRIEGPGASNASVAELRVAGVGSDGKIGDRIRFGRRSFETKNSKIKFVSTSYHCRSAGLVIFFSS